MNVTLILFPVQLLLNMLMCMHLDLNIHSLSFPPITGLPLLGNQTFEGVTYLDDKRAIGFHMRNYEKAFIQLFE